MNEDTPGKKVKVVDRRSFTPDGEPREPQPGPPSGATTGTGDPAITPPSKASSAPGSTAQPTATAAEQGSSSPAGPSVAGNAAEASPPDRDGLGAPAEFLEIVELLAEPAAALLTGTVPGYPQDVTAARRFIDLLAVLRTKTEGNLTPDEDRVLDDAIFQLHRLFLSAGR